MKDRSCRWTSGRQLARHGPLCDCETDLVALTIKDESRGVYQCKIPIIRQDLYLIRVSNNSEGSSVADTHPLQHSSRHYPASTLLYCPLYISSLAYSMRPSNSISPHRLYTPFVDSLCERLLSNIGDPIFVELRSCEKFSSGGRSRVEE